MTTPALWATLYSDSGVSLVVPADIEPVEALCRLLEEEYGGEFSRTNPVVVAEASGMRIEAWRECSEEEAADYGADLDHYNSWWAPGGSGSEVIHVLSYDGAIFDLGERAEAAEEKP